VLDVKAYEISDVVYQLHYKFSQWNVSVMLWDYEYILQLYFQASQAESHVFNCLRELEIPGLWLVFFQGRSYGGKSFRKERNGKLIMREHDYVFFTSYNGQYFQKQLMK
jgi:hypothetical protein